MQITRKHLEITIKKIKQKLLQLMKNYSPIRTYQTQAAYTMTYLLYLWTSPEAKTEQPMSVVQDIWPLLSTMNNVTQRNSSNTSKQTVIIFAANLNLTKNTLEPVSTVEQWQPVHSTRDTYNSCSGCRQDCNN